MGCGVDPIEREKALQRPCFRDPEIRTLMELDEEERWEEIERLSKDQLSHKTDLPPPRRPQEDAERWRVYEIPFDPFLIDVLQFDDRGLRQNSYGGIVEDDYSEDSFP